MALPKISIVTPSLNQGQFLEQTILSVISQGYPNLEYLVIDGGSNDDSIDIIKKYERQITSWTSEKDLGQSDAINKGIQKATGEIFNWINADDYYEPGALLKVGEIFLDNSTHVVAGKSRTFGESTERVISGGTRIFQNNLPKTIGWAVIDQPATFFRKHLMNELGMLNVNLHYLMDREWWIKYLLQFGLPGIVKVNEVLVNFRLHKDSKTVSLLEHFNRERDNIFYGMARHFNLETEAMVISSLTSVDKSYQFNPIKNTLSPVELKQVFNYYFLLRGNEFYFNLQKRNAETCFSMVDNSLLESDDKFFFRTLFLKHKFIPYPLREFYKSR